MARIQYVKRAQQRYATKPVIDPETGEQKRVPLMRNGQQMTTKSGALRWQRQSVRDTSRPLPMPRCDFPTCEDREIKPGTPYVYVDLKVGGTKYRHAEHPRWQPWDLSNAMWAQIAQLVDGVENELDGLGDFDDADAVADVLTNAAEEARGLAEQRTEAADNMEDGFGHETESSATLREHADNIENWADDLDSWQAAEEPPEPDEFRYDEEGTEIVEGYDTLDDGDRYNDEQTSLADAWTDWRESVLDSARELLQDTPEV